VGLEDRFEEVEQKYNLGLPSKNEDLSTPCSEMSLKVRKVTF
jgi:hypothetical protein